MSKRLFERPHPRYASDSPREGMWMTCDDCGFVWSAADMAFQVDYFGTPNLQQTNLIKCPRCTDKPSEQQRLTVTQIDPAPWLITRPENYAVDATDFRVTDDLEQRATDDDASRVVNETLDTPDELS